MNKPTRACIAIVEDDDSLGRSLARLLQASRYQPVVYSSAEAFLSDAKQPQFDCLIVDIQLGGMTGIELSERLATSGSMAPLIFLTAHEDRQGLEQRIDTPFFGFLSKNDRGELVLATIDKAIHGQQIKGDTLT
jgi:FixJ family two-component response regulator